MTVGADFSEVAKFAVTLDLTPRRVAAQLKPILVAQAALGAEAMKARLPDPEPTGEHLRESVTADTTAHSARGNPYAEFGPEWFVARFREYGTTPHDIVNPETGATRHHPGEPPRPFAEASGGDVADGFVNAVGAIAAYL